MREFFMLNVARVSFFQLLRGKLHRDVGKSRRSSVKYSDVLLSYTERSTTQNEDVNCSHFS